MCQFAPCGRPLSFSWRCPSLTSRAEETRAQALEQPALEAFRGDTRSFCYGTPLASTPDMWRGCWTLVLLVVCTPADTSSGSDCGPTVPSPSAVTDRQKAEHSRKVHLEALFNRSVKHCCLCAGSARKLVTRADEIFSLRSLIWENGSISLAGLKRLLQSLGLERIRTVTVQHHEKPGHHHHHDNHHNHSHNHHKHHHHHHHHHHTNHTNHNHNHTDQPNERFSSEGDTKPDEFETNEVPESNTTSGARRVKREEPTSSLITSLQTSGRSELQPHDRDATCLNASTFLASHGLASEGRLTPGDFALLCPSLLDQLDLGACVRHSTGVEHHHGNHSEAVAGESRSILIAWAGGFTSISIISLLSLLGVVLIPS
ncbi:hypothetical protein WMY93_000419 [Mugilogobius chulae]|uniref:Uncharacterized protein n=1 Tax=Mugilogobius chulae TaxID=88201 RepID=A0AAW0PZA3_9GOBI